MESNNNKLLLSLVAVLLLIKFAVMPIFDWQAEKIDQINSLHKREVKAAELLAQKEHLMQQVQLVEKKLADQQQAFPTFATSEDFRLETQKLLEELLKKHELNVKQIFWRNNKDVDVMEGMYKARVSVRMYGKVKDFALLHADVVTDTPSVKVVAMGLQTKQQSKTSAGTFKGVITFEAIYWRKGGKRVG